jgi:hypothetical protein
MLLSPLHGAPDTLSIAILAAALFPEVKLDPQH